VSDRYKRIKEKGSGGNKKRKRSGEDTFSGRVVKTWRRGRRQRRGRKKIAFTGMRSPLVKERKGGGKDAARETKLLKEGSKGETRGRRQHIPQVEGGTIPIWERKGLENPGN